MNSLSGKIVLMVFGFVNLATSPALVFSQDMSGPSSSLRALRAYLGSNHQDETIKCGFAAITAARNLRDSLSGEMKIHLDRVLQRPSTQKSIVVGFFRIHFDTVGDNTPVLLDSNRSPLPGGYAAFVDSVGAIANHVLGFETGPLGYLPPPSDNGAGGGNEYDIYIQNLGNVYGYTDNETQVIPKPNGGTWTSFILIDNDFTFVSPHRNIGLPALRVTLAHEFHHAIQMGSYGYWSGHEYFYEITSTWMEDVLYTDVNDYLQYLFDHFRRPEEPFTKFEVGSNIQYSRCIWGHFVAKRFGRDAMRLAWEEIRNAVPLQAMDNALQAPQYSSSFRLAFAEFSKWNFFTGSKADTSLYYPEGPSYPAMTQIPVGFTPPSRAVGGSVSQLAARYIQVLGTMDTLTLALSNINFEAGLTSSNTQFPFTYRLDVQQVDGSYHSTPVGIFFKLDVPDLTNWWTWVIVTDSVGSVVDSSSVTNGKPFPNPLIADGKTSVYIPVKSADIQGTLSIFTSNMDLIFSSVLTSEKRPSGQQAFGWRGITNSDTIVRTGVYLFVLEVQGRKVIGKIAVVRK